MTHTIPPVFDKMSKVLVLGSFPSTSAANRAGWDEEKLVLEYKVIADTLKNG